MKPKMIYRVMLRSLLQDIAMGKLHDGLSFSCYFSTSYSRTFSTHSVFKPVIITFSSSLFAC